MQKKLTIAIVGIVITAVIILSIGTFLYLSQPNDSNNDVDHNGDNQDNQTYFTEFYVLDENGTTQNYPCEVKVNETSKIIIGIESHEKNITEYTVKIILTKNNVTFTNLTLGVFNRILVENETNETLYAYQIKEVGEYKVVFQLIYNDHKNTEVIANLHIWVNVTNH
jgi:uncharacterized membrane protein